MRAQLSILFLLHLYMSTGLIADIPVHVVKTINRVSQQTRPMVHRVVGVDVAGTIDVVRLWILLMRAQTTC